MCSDRLMWFLQGPKKSPDRNTRSMIFRIGFFSECIDSFQKLNNSRKFPLLQINNPSWEIFFFQIGCSVLKLLQLSDFFFDLWISYSKRQKNTDSASLCTSFRLKLRYVLDTKQLIWLLLWIHSPFMAIKIGIFSWQSICNFHSITNRIFFPFNSILALD